MQEHEPPTWNDSVTQALAQLDTAHEALSQAQDLLASDRRPPEASLSDAAATARLTGLDHISEAKTGIDQAAGYLDQTRDDSGGGPR